MVTGLDLLDQAIVDHLDGHIIGGHARPAELSDVPDGAGWQGEPGASAFAPYLRIDPLPADRDGQMLADPHALVDAEWLIKGVSTRPGQAKQLAVEAAAHLVGDPPAAPAGLVLTRLRHPTTTGAYRDDDTIPELYVAAARVAIRIQAV